MNPGSLFDLSYISCIYNAYWFYKQLHSGKGQLRALRNRGVEDKRAGEWRRRGIWGEQGSVIL
jgi:hypothetical protein